MITVKIDPIKPAKDFLNSKIYQRAIENAGNMTAKAVEVDFHVTTRTWVHQPDFEIDHTSGSGEWKVSTSDEIYGYVSGGTKPHIIKPKRARMLRFYTGFRPKTRMSYIGSNKGSKGNKAVWAKAVANPGISGRFFEVAIKRKWDNEWPRQLARAIRAANTFR